MPILVGGAITILKNSNVNGKDDIPYIIENKKCSKPPSSCGLSCLVDASSQQNTRLFKSHRLLPGMLRRTPLCCGHAAWLPPASLALRFGRNSESHNGKHRKSSPIVFDPPCLRHPARHGTAWMHLRSTCSILTGDNMLGPAALHPFHMKREKTACDLILKWTCFRTLAPICAVCLESCPEPNLIAFNSAKTFKTFNWKHSVK